MSEINDRLLTELVDAVKEIVHKEESDRLRDVYLIGDIEKDTARAAIEKLREFANTSRKPITLYINSAGGNVTDGLAIHVVVHHLVSTGIEVTITWGMAYSMGWSCWGASPGDACIPTRGSQFTSRRGRQDGIDDAAAHHLDRLKQIEPDPHHGGPIKKPLRGSSATQGVDFYLDAWSQEIRPDRPGARRRRLLIWRRPRHRHAVQNSPPELTIHGRSTSKRHRTPPFNRRAVRAPLRAPPFVSCSWHRAGGTVVDGRPFLP
jgi:hypothetical protein